MKYTIDYYNKLSGEWVTCGEILADSLGELVGRIYMRYSDKGDVHFNKPSNYHKEHNIPDWLAFHVGEGGALNFVTYRVNYDLRNIK